MVEKTGFEPATPWSQTKCTTKLCYFSIQKAVNQLNYLILYYRFGNYASKFSHFYKNITSVIVLKKLTSSSNCDNIIYYSSTITIFISYCTINFISSCHITSNYNIFCFICIRNIASHNVCQFTRSSRNTF